MKIQLLRIVAVLQLCAFAAWAEADPQLAAAGPSRAAAPADWTPPRLLALDPAIETAVLQSADKEPQAFSAGQSVAPGWTLQSVRADSILLRSTGRHLRVYLDPSRPAQTILEQAPAQPTQPSWVIREAQTIPVSAKPQATTGAHQTSANPAGDGP